jgi:hypothetical protein
MLICFIEHLIESSLPNIAYTWMVKVCKKRPIKQLNVLTSQRVKTWVTYFLYQWYRLLRRPKSLTLICILKETKKDTINKTNDDFGT